MPEGGKPVCFHRIDPRLVHATLLEAWIPHLEATHLVVADRESAMDPRRRTIIQMAARDITDIRVVDEAEVPAVLDELNGSEPTMVVYPSLEAFHAALQSGLRCPRVHVGHLPAGDGRKRVHPSVFVGPEELDWVDRIESRGVEVVVRPLPTDQMLALRKGGDERPVLTEDLPLITPAAAGPDPAPLASPNPLPVASTESSIQRQQGMVTVVNERGLHLRAAHLLAQRAGAYRASVEVGLPGRMVNAKSLLGITTLGAGPGTELELHVEGPDAPTAFQDIASLFAGGFEEGSE